MIVRHGPRAPGTGATREARSPARPRAIALVLALATLAVYAQVAGHAFVNYDDNVYVTANPPVQGGLSLETIRWAFTTGHTGNWHPLTWLSLLTDVRLFGVSARAIHLVNVLLHVASTALLFLLFHRITREAWKSAFIAVLFGLHPLHVESVAWAAERKDVLSTFFWILTTWAYVRYVGRPGIASYLLTLVLFALGLLAKPMLVTLPFVLLLMDWWPLRRWTPGAAQPARPAKGPAPRPSAQRPIAFLLREKLPFLALVVVSSAATYVAQQRGGAVSEIGKFPLDLRLGNALISYVRYIFKTLAPTGLAVFYPHPLTWPGWAIGGSILLLALISLWVARQASRTPALAVGWLWYLGTLVPVIGIIQVGAQSIADRYMYVPMIGLSLMLAWGLPELAPAAWRRSIRPWLPATIVGVLLAALTWRQVGTWRDSGTLFQHAAAVTGENWLAHEHLAYLADEQGDEASAYRHYLEAIRAKPDDVEAHNNLGVLLTAQSKYDEARSHFDEAIRRNPKFPNAHYNLALMLVKQGRRDEAMAQYAEAIRLRPGYADAHLNLGNLLAERGRIAEATAEYDQVLRLDPRNAKAHFAAAFYLSQQGRMQEALAHYAEAARDDPGSAQLQFYYGEALARVGRYDEAIAHYQVAQAAQPPYPGAAAAIEKARAQQGARAPSGGGGR